ncbi:MAG: cupin domain-containing protein [Planctomycetota bacterium]
MPSVKDIVVRKPGREEIQQCKTWPVWTCEPSTFDWEYTQKETCLILEGKVTVKDRNSQVCFGPGDLVVFPNDLSCTWVVEEAVRKHYNFE